MTIAKYCILLLHVLQYSAAVDAAGGKHTITCRALLFLFCIFFLFMIVLRLLCALCHVDSLIDCLIGVLVGWLVIMIIYLISILE